MGEDGPDPETLKMLLEYGFDPKVDKNYAICAAAVCGYTNVVQMLIDFGADLHKENPLIDALRESRKETALILLENGAESILSGHTSQTKCVNFVSTFNPLESSVHQK